jgi:hypothetical protein
MGGLAPDDAAACACGCGVFDVATSSMLPGAAGGTIFLEYDFMNQNKNWSGVSSSPAADNDDKNIRTQFVTLGGQYRLDDDWRLIADIPYWQRQFKTLDDDGVDIDNFNHGAPADIRIKAAWSGNSDDRTAGITFGLKLPTGDSSYAGFDPDTSISSGSTDLLLGTYKFGSLSDDGSWQWSANAEYDQPVLHKPGYVPGAEIDAVFGVSYGGWAVGTARIVPITQLIASYRMRDTGANADPAGSGYGRLLVTPGLQLTLADFKILADVGLPVFQDVRGNQLVASELYKLNVSYNF